MASDWGKGIESRGLAMTEAYALLRQLHARQPQIPVTPIWGRER